MVIPLPSVIQLLNLYQTCKYLSREECRTVLFLFSFRPAEKCRVTVSVRFGCLDFNEETMKNRLSSTYYIAWKTVLHTIPTGSDRCPAQPLKNTTVSFVACGRVIEREGGLQGSAASGRISDRSSWAGTCLSESEARREGLVPTRNQGRPLHRR